MLRDPVVIFEGLALMLLAALLRHYGVLHSLPTWSLYFAIASTAVIYTNTLREAHRQHHGQDRLLRSLSTKSVGPIENHMTDIADVVEQARHLLRIRADCSEYGSVAAPEKYDSVQRAIEKALEGGTEVRMLIVGSPELWTRTNPLRRLSFEEVRHTPTYQRYRSRFRGETEPASLEDFESTVLRRQELVTANYISRGAKVEFLPEGSPAAEQFVWIADSEEAVYVSPRPGAVAFRTRDHQILKDLVANFDRDWPAKAGDIGPKESNCAPRSNAPSTGSPRGVSTR